MPSNYSLKLPELFKWPILNCLLCPAFLPVETPLKAMAYVLPSRTPIFSLLTILMSFPWGPAWCACCAPPLGTVSITTFVFLPALVSCLMATLDWPHNEQTQNTFPNVVSLWRFEFQAYMMFHLSEELLFSISCKAGLLATHSLCFCLS